MAGWSPFHAVYRQYGLETDLYCHGNRGRASPGGVRRGQRSSVAIDDATPGVGHPEAATSGSQTLCQLLISWNENTEFAYFRHMTFPSALDEFIKPDCSC